jgi:hypothetical protein
MEDSNMTNQQLQESSLATPANRRGNQTNRGDYSSQASGIGGDLYSMARRFVEWAQEMLYSLTRRPIDIQSIKMAVDKILEIESEYRYEYLVTLLHPELGRGSKIPSSLPIPTSSFTIRNTLVVSPNSSGMLAGVFNPFFLDNAGTQSTLYINNNAALTGNSPSNFFNSTDIGMSVPANIYNQFRLVSASLSVKYIGRLDIVQGTIGMAIAYEPGATSSSFGGTLTVLQKYGNFNSIQDGIFFQENYTLSGTRGVYFPLDTTFEAFQNLGSYKPGFAFVFYIQDGVYSATQSSYKLEIILNYEALPDVQFLSYIPTSMPINISNEVKQLSVMSAQKSPIGALTSSLQNDRANDIDFWEKLRNANINITSK